MTPSAYIIPGLMQKKPYLKGLNGKAAIIKRIKPNVVQPTKNMLFVRFVVDYIRKKHNVPLDTFYISKVPAHIKLRFAAVYVVYAHTNIKIRHIGYMIRTGICSLDQMDAQIEGDKLFCDSLDVEVWGEWQKRDIVSSSQFESSEPVGSGSTPAIEHIAAVVAKDFKISESEIRFGRHPNRVEARSFCYRLAREITPLDLKPIGRYFDGRDHSTVVHSLNDFEDKKDLPHIKKRYDRLKEMVLKTWRKKNGE